MVKSMVKVITYGTFDCFHYGHQRLLERARALGDYLIVGVTSEDFDIARGKINVKQSLEERIDAVKATGLADKVIVEEYPGQKIDDIQRYQADIFTVGSDWEGQFDYLNEYCQVIYLPRTEGISSTDERTEENYLNLFVYGNKNTVVEKFIHEAGYVNGLHIEGVFEQESKDFQSALKEVDAVYVASSPMNHFRDIKNLLEQGIHVLCESPIALKRRETEELFQIAKKNNLILMEADKTAYSLAFQRMLLLLKTGVIGNVISVDATDTSLVEEKIKAGEKVTSNGSLVDWGTTALMAVFSVLGTNYLHKHIDTIFRNPLSFEDSFTKIDFAYNHSVASIKVADGAKSEGELIISGTKGYVYVPSPWWKMNYFEVRYENPNDNMRYYYQLKGEGIRTMIVSFVKEIKGMHGNNRIPQEISCKTAEIIEDFMLKKEVTVLQ